MSSPMPPLLMLDQACDAFKHNDVSAKLVAIRTLLNDERARLNAHTHSGISSLANIGVTAAVAVAVANPFELNRCCHAMAQIAGFFDNVKTLTDEFRTKFNAHGHEGTTSSHVPSSAAISATAITVNNIHAQWLSDCCPALGRADGNPGAGAYFQGIAALANELKTKYNTHYHNAAYTNVTSTPALVTTIPTLS